MQDQVAKCLKEFSNEDRDFRYMALVDLEKIIVQSETETNAKLVLDKHEEVGAELIKLLKDPLAEIQTEAINCIGTYSKSVRIEGLEQIISELLELIKNTNKKEGGELRVVYSTAVKRIITDNINESVRIERIQKIAVGAVTKQLGDKGTIGEEDSELVEVLEAVLKSTKKHFEGLAGVDEIGFRVVESSGQGGVYRAANGVVAHYSRVAGAKEAQKIVERVLHELENKDKQMKYMHLLFMVIQEAKGIDNEEVLEAILKILQDEEQIEGWESAMLIIEQILVDGVKMNNMDLIGRVVEICRDKIKYDPNYIDDDMDEDEEYIEEDDEYAEEYVDEEDDGWRYRKAAAKVIKEVGKVYQKEYAREALCILKSRLNDREEVVKREILGGVSSIFLSIGETHGVQLPKEDVYEILTRIESERNKKGKSEELIKAELNCYLATIEVVKNSVGDFGKEVDAKILEKVVGENKEYFGNEIEVFKIIQGVYSACGKVDSINNEMAAVTLKELSEKMENGERSVIIEAIQTATVVLNKCEVQRNKEVIGELILDKAEKMRASGRNDPELAKKYMAMMLGLVENEKYGVCPVRADELISLFTELLGIASIQAYVLEKTSLLVAKLCPFISMEAIKPLIEQLMVVYDGNNNERCGTIIDILVSLYSQSKYKDALGAEVDLIYNRLGVVEKLMGLSTSEIPMISSVLQLFINTIPYLSAKDEVCENVEFLNSLVVELRIFRDAKLRSLGLKLVSVLSLYNQHISEVLVKLSTENTHQHDVLLFVAECYCCSISRVLNSTVAYDSVNQALLGMFNDDNTLEFACYATGSFNDSGFLSDSIVEKLFSQLKSQECSLDAVYFAIGKVAVTNQLARGKLFEALSSQLSLQLLHTSSELNHLLECLIVMSKHTEVVSFGSPADVQQEIHDIVRRLVLHLTRAPEYLAFDTENEDLGLYSKIYANLMLSNIQLFKNSELPQNKRLELVRLMAIKYTITQFIQVISTMDVNAANNSHFEVIKSVLETLSNISHSNIIEDAEMFCSKYYCLQIFYSLVSSSAAKSQKGARVSGTGTQLLLEMFNSGEFVSGINSSCEVVSELVKKEKVGPFVHTTDMGKSLRKLAFDIVSVLYEHDHSKYLNTVVKLGLMDTFVPIVVTSLGMMITEKLTADEITHCFDLLIAGISHIKSAWGSGVKAGTDGGSGGKKTTSSGSAGLNEQKSANEDKAVVVERCDCLVESLKVTLQNAGGESKYEECLAKLADL